ncbi:hypothetical protein [Sphaerisporangium dianthi]|uniref:WXG100 family type VII secretion target n=1 Tax=Sphaerisporangium dianthi TaxID=1436120 RepID=A0ABV9C9T1_9ACTN
MSKVPAEDPVPGPSGGPGQVLDVSPSGIGDIGRLFDGQGEELADAAREATRRLMDIGDFWGSDDAGRAFHDGKDGKAGYGARAADLESEVHALATAYALIGDRLVMMGRNVAVADWASIARMLEGDR